MNNLNKTAGKVITFYSYKGGVGRSMALINIACLLGKDGYKVLLIDWDLEAPGLHTYFNEDIKETDAGLIDLIVDAKDFLKLKKNNNEKSLKSYLKKNIDFYIKKNLSSKEQKELQKKKNYKNNLEFSIDLLKAGNFDDEYTTKLSSINWIEFYENTPEFFRLFSEELSQKYDYILIDSRTGLADTSGICTMLMPDALVTVFALNKQNIDGVIRVAEQSLKYRFSSHDSRNLIVYPLPARIDSNSSKNYQFWEDIYNKKFEKVFKDIYKLDEFSLRKYFDIAHIQYDADFSYGENIPVLFQNLNNSNYISYDYSRFCDILEKNIQPWNYISEEEIGEIIEKAFESDRLGKYKDSIEKLEKILPFRKKDGSIYALLASTYIEYSKQLDNKQSYIKKAFEYAKKQFDLSGDSYNLACAYSLLGDVENSLIYLEKTTKDEGYNRIYLLRLINKDLEYDFFNIRNNSRLKEILKELENEISNNDDHLLLEK